MSVRNIIIAAALVILATGCQKVLDIKPESTLDASTRFKTINDYQFALLGAYGLFQSTSYYGSIDQKSNAFATLPDMLADDLRETVESLSNERVFSRWTYAEDEVQIEDTWLAGYRIIMQANLSMNGIEKFSATRHGAVNRIKGQALTIRALVHFDLMRYWADTYSRNSDSLGVPYITTYNYEQKPARNTIKQNYDSIEKDLKAAIAMFNDVDKEINGAGERAYMDQHVANAILARMYLYSGQMDSAIKYSTRVIDAFPLAPINEFPKIWTDASTEEVVWSLSFDAGQGQVGGNAYAPDVNRSQYAPPASLANLYDKINDIRYSSYIAIIPDNNGNDRRVLSKYLAKFSRLKKPDGVVNFKAFRTGEMYLIRAEAYLRKAAPDEASALADLNTLRDARIFDYVPAVLTGAALRDAIETERRKELVAEGHRFFDLKRKGRLARQVSRAGCTSGACTLLPSSRAWTWPVPRPEIDANPNIGAQNPGY